MQEINLTCYVVFHLCRNTTNFHVKTEALKMDREIIMETMRDYFTTATTIFGRLICDPLRQIKRRIGYILLEEFCATSDEQLLGT